MQGEAAASRQGLRSCVLGLAIIVAAVVISSNADARHHPRHVHVVRHSARVHHHAGAGGYSPPSASIVVDGNSGRVLEAANADALRHPASLTKVMTLYLLFERLKAGEIKLDTRLKISAHAAAQAPTKLNLKPGQTITVEDAIKAIVTRSANDAAVVIAENLGGSEETFARLMTQTAHKLGMSRTTYVNASGLPDDDQITTARDLALLGLAIEDRFPRYYRFFSTTSFVFRGETIRGHDHLLGTLAGVDGIKTGFTRGSGFNLLSSLHRDGRYLVGVVLGGRSVSQRDAHMRQLLNADFSFASTRSTSAFLAGRAEKDSEHMSVVVAKARARPRGRLTQAAARTQRPPAGSTDPIRPIPVKTIAYRTVRRRIGSLAAMPALAPVVAAPPAAVAKSPALAPHAVIASAGAASAATAAPPPRSVAPMRDAAAQSIKFAAPAPPAHPHTHSGWMIQIGAFDDEGEAQEHLNQARLKLQATLAAAEAFTEPVLKGDTTLYRARFAGFDEEAAKAACRRLKRNDFSCMTLKD